MRFKSPWIEKKRKFQYNLVEEKRKELPMTKVVPISITISIEKGEGAHCLTIKVTIKGNVASK